MGIRRHARRTLSNDSASHRRLGLACQELLEARTLFSTFTVTNLADSGPGSLRSAITAANLSPAPDVVKFAPSLKGTIPLASEIPVTNDLTIAGSGDKITV